MESTYHAKKKDMHDDYRIIKNKLNTIEKVLKYEDGSDEWYLSEIFSGREALFHLIEKRGSV